MDTEKISNVMSKSRKLLNAYIPDSISVYPFSLMMRNVMMGEAYKTAASEFRRYRYEVIRRTHSNNWLRLHGYPMKRDH